MNYNMNKVRTMMEDKNDYLYNIYLLPWEVNEYYNILVTFRNTNILSINNKSYYHLTLILKNKQIPWYFNNF